MGALIFRYALVLYSLLCSVVASADTERPSTEPAQVKTGPNIVRLDLASCEESVASEGLLAQLRVELGFLGFALTMLDEPYAVTLSISFPDCAHKPEAVEIALRSQSDGVSAVNRLDMADTQLEDRPRALALSVSELARHELHAIVVHARASARAQPADGSEADLDEPVAESPLEPGPIPLPASSDHGQSVREPLEEPAAENVRNREHADALDLSLRASGVIRLLASKGQVLSGASVHAIWTGVPYLEVALGIEALTGRRDVYLGRYRVASLLSETSIDVVWGDRLRMRAGPRLLLGESFAHGVADRAPRPALQASVVSNATRELSLGMGASAGVQLRVLERLSIRADFGAGVFLRGLAIRLDHQSYASTRGAWLDATIGLAYRF